MGPGRDLRAARADQKTASDYVRAIIDQAVVLAARRSSGRSTRRGLIGPHDDEEKSSSSIS